VENSAGRFALPAARAPGGPAPKSIDELLGREQAPTSAVPGTKVHGFRMRAGNQWDVDALDASGLRLFDADVRLQVAALKAGRLQAAALQAGIELKSGVMRVSITDGQLAGGAVRGLASVDARQPALVVGANLSGDHVALKPLLDMAGIEPLEGKGRIIVAVSAQGASERELISTLAGRAEVKVVDGALLGWDADAIMDGLAHGKMPPAHRQPGARTPFKELSATFQIAHGVARTRDLKLESPAMLSSGNGTINIVDRNIDLQLKPRVAVGGLEVPVRVAGNWDNPTVVADVAGALKSPQAQEAARHLKEGNVDGALRSVLGNGPKADAKIDKAKELMRGLLGRDGSRSAR
jgi:AsmA protein